MGMGGGAVADQSGDVNKFQQIKKKKKSVKRVSKIKQEDIVHTLNIRPRPNIKTKKSELEQ